MVMCIYIYIFQGWPCTASSYWGTSMTETLKSRPSHEPAASTCCANIAAAEACWINEGLGPRLEPWKRSFSSSGVLHPKRNIVRGLPNKHAGKRVITKQQRCGLKWFDMVWPNSLLIISHQQSVDFPTRTRGHDLMTYVVLQESTCNCGDVENLNISECAQSDGIL